MSKIILPYLNPIKFHKFTPDESARYLTRHMEEWNHRNTIEDWQTPSIYAQPFQTTDNITLQFQSSFDEVNQEAELINCQGQVFLTLAITQGAESEEEPGLFLYEIDEPLTSIADGYYYLRITAQGTPDLVIVSEPLHIKDSHPYSRLLEYTNYQFKDGIVFETGLVYQLRVHGKLDYKIPASKDVSYEDQSLDMTLLDSVPYRIWELYVGGKTGIPDYLVDRINRVLGCSSLCVDGKYFTKSEGAKLEEKASDDERYTLRGWKVDLQEAENPYAVEFSTEEDAPPPTPTQLEKPELVLVVDSASQITASWGAITNASYYTLLRGISPNIAFARVIYSGSALSHVSTGLGANRAYFYFLRAEGVSPYLPSDYDFATAVTSGATPPSNQLDAPVLTLTAIDTDTIQASWTYVSPATGFELYIATTNDFGSTTLVYSGTDTDFTINSLTADTTYYGWVRALGNTTTYPIWLDSPYGTDFETTMADPGTTTFDTVLFPDDASDPSDFDQGVFGYFGTGHPDSSLEFNSINPRSGTGVRMTIKVGGANAGTFDFTSDYCGQYFQIIYDGGTPYIGIFPNINSIINF